MWANRSLPSSHHQQVQQSLSRTSHGCGQKICKMFVLGLGYMSRTWRGCGFHTEGNPSLGAKNQVWPTAHQAQHIVDMVVMIVMVVSDTVTEWLRWWTRNPLGSARRGSNPLGVVLDIGDDPRSAPCVTFIWWTWIACRQILLLPTHFGRDACPCFPSHFDWQACCCLCFLAWLQETHWC